MLPTTKTAIRSILSTDPTIDAAARSAALAALDGKPMPATSAQPTARILRRAEVAKRFNVTLRAVDGWSRAGILKKVCLPGRTRAAGFREADIVALIENRTVEASHAA